MLTGKIIDNEKTRILTFERRKKSLFKKASELSILCEVEVCVVVGGCPSANHRNDQWQTWPENLGEVERIIRKFEVKKSSTRLVNISNIVVQRQENVGEQSGFPLWDSRIDCFSFERLQALLEVLDKKSAAVDERMTALRTERVNELPIIEFSNEELKIKNEYINVHGLQTGHSETDWIDNLNLDNLSLPDFLLNSDLFYDFSMEPSKEIVQSEIFRSLPEPEYHSIAVNFPMEPISEMVHVPPEQNCSLKEMNYYSIAVGEPSQWSSLPPLPHSIAPWPEFPPANDSGIPIQIQHIPIKLELERGVEHPEHDGFMEDIGNYSTAVYAPTPPSELLPVPCASTSSMAAFLPPAELLPLPYVSTSAMAAFLPPAELLPVPYASTSAMAAFHPPAELLPLPYASTSAMAAFLPPAEFLHVPYASTSAMAAFLPPAELLPLPYASGSAMDAFLPPRGVLPLPYASTSDMAFHSHAKLLPPFPYASASGMAFLPPAGH